MTLSETPLALSPNLRGLAKIGMLLALGMAQATGDLIVVSETGEPFRLYLNGEWILDQPGTRAEAHDLHEGFHKGTLYLYPSEGKAIQLKKTFLVEGGHVEYYAIRKNRKGQYTVTVYNRALKTEPLEPPLTGGPVFPPLTPPDPPFPTTSPSSPANTGQVQTNTQNQTIIFNPTIQIQTGGGGTQVGGGGPVTPPPPVYTGPTYSGPCNCQQPMSREAFQRALATVHNQTFDNTRLDIAKNIARTNCLLARDVRALAAALQFENNRMDFAKFAYDYTLDVSSYFEVAEAFDFEHSRIELMAYVRQRGARFACQNVPLGPPTMAPSNPGFPPPSTSSPANPPNTSCQPCMPAESFANALRSIQNTASDATRLEVAKSLLTTNCLSAQQVRDICGIFTSEANRLDFAKTAYCRCCDPQNYLLVHEAFASTLSREELAKYIQMTGR